MANITDPITGQIVENPMGNRDRALAQFYYNELTAGKNKYSDDKLKKMYAAVQAADLPQWFDKYGKVGNGLSTRKEANGNIGLYSSTGTRIGDLKDPGAPQEHKGKGIGGLLTNLGNTVQSIAGSGTNAVGSLVTGGNYQSLGDDIEKGIEKVGPAVEQGVEDIGKGLGGLLGGGGGGAGAGDPYPVPQEIRDAQRNALLLQEKALDEHDKYYGSDLYDEVDPAMQKNIKNASRKHEQDRRALQNQIVTRGMGDTSRGLNSLLAADSAYSGAANDLLAGRNKAIRNTQQARFDSGLNIGGAVAGSQQFPVAPEQEPQQKQGLLPLLGAGLGAWAAGPGNRAEGAQVGMGAGMAGQGFYNARRR